MAIPRSSRVDALPGYAFAEVGKLVAELKESGADVVDFGVGDPRAPTPELVRRAGQEAIDRHRSSGYPSYIGSPSFRQAVADWVGRRFGVCIDAARHVTATIGSKESVFHAPLAFVNPGDIVISPNPGYPPMARGALFAGAESWLYPVTPERGCVPDLTTVPEDVLARTKMVWVNSPNSPTGVVADLPALSRAADFCREHGILLASDEAYCDLWFGDGPPPSTLQTGLEGVLSFFSLSKRSNMTGWRCGYVVGDEEAVGLFRKLKTNIDSGTPDFVQDASIAALADEEHVIQSRAEYARKRDLICGAFAEIGLPDSRSEATMFLWQRVPQGMCAVNFAKRLLDPSVALVVTPGPWLSSPGDSGDPGQGFVRLALVPTVEECEEAARRIARLSLS